MIQCTLMTILLSFAAAAPLDKSELLEKVRGISELTSLSFVAEIKEDSPALTKHPAVKRTVRVNVVMADGAKFRVEGFQGDKPLGTIVSDGAQVTEYDPSKKLWTRYQMPKFDKDYYHKPLLVMDHLVKRYATSWVDAQGPYLPDIERAVDSNETVFLSARNVEGRDCVGLRHTRTELGPGSLIREKNVMYFDAENYLLARETMSASSTLLLLRNYNGTRETDYLDVQANPVLSDDTFTFTPPADAKYIAPNDPALPKPPSPGRAPE